MIAVVGIWLAAYLLGALPFGYLVAKSRGVNIFAQGSGNIGATNVARVLGKRFGILVFVLDFLKGAVPVLLARHLFPSLSGLTPWLTAGWLEVGAGLAAFLGHLYPVYLQFRGGKGVATGAGVVCILVPWAALGAVLVWTIFLLGSRFVAVASIASALALVLLQVSLPGGMDLGEPRTLFCLMASALVFVRHRGNVARLLEGTEPRMNHHPALLTLAKTIHVLALGAWFGSAIFFSLPVALSLFGSFDGLARAEARPAWFPLAEPFDKIKPELNGPVEQGSRAAGYAIGPLFVWYFIVQGVCGCLAFGAAWPWRDWEPNRRVHTWRAYLLLGAVATVVIGWPLEQYVAGLRGPRNESSEAYLRAGPDHLKEREREMKSARAAFGAWHGVSILLNYVTLGLVAAAMALAAQLPVASEPKKKENPGDLLEN